MIHMYRASFSRYFHSRNRNFIYKSLL